MFHKEKEREETRVNSWWMFFHGHLQTGCCSSALPSTSLFAPHLQGTQRGCQGSSSCWGHQSGLE